MSVANFVFGQSDDYKAARAAPASEYDRGLAWSALLLASLGLVMVYSSSIATAESSRYTGYNATWFLFRHALFLGCALAAALAVFLLPVRFWQSAAPWLFTGTLALLVLVLVPGVGREVNGAKRWINLYALNVQPS